MVSDRTDPSVRIFDTTLRDGEQSPGASLTSDEKLILARHIAALGVDVIEAGFPAASPDDLAAVQRIAGEVGGGDGPIIAGLARACAGDVERAWEAVRPARRPRIHTFLATSDLHLEHKLGMSRDQMVDRTGEMVAYARGFCDDVEFSPEDAGRSCPEFLIRVLQAAIEAGATTLNIPDTVGYALPEEYGALIARLIRDTPGTERAVWSVHCHDDLGLATANTLAGIRAGARQAEVTVNGIGERAGNASLEEVVMAIATRRPQLGFTTGVDSRRLTRVSRMVSRYTGIEVPPNKAVVGRNAFAHEAGIHQDGMLKDQRTYEIMTPESVGLEHTRLVLGKHSGRHAFRARLEEMGVELGARTLDEAFRHFKQLADRKKQVTDADLLALIREEVGTVEERFRLGSLQVVCGPPDAATATVKLIGRGGAEEVGAAVGTGSVDAVFRAIGKIVGEGAELVDFTIRNVTEGADALGEVSVRIASGDGSSVPLRGNGSPVRRNGSRRVHSGYGTDTDVIVASAKAYLAAINRMLAAAGEPAPVSVQATAAIGVPAVASAPAAGAPAPYAFTEEPFDSDYTAGIP